MWDFYKLQGHLVAMDPKTKRSLKAPGLFNWVHQGFLVCLRQKLDESSHQYKWSDFDKPLQDLS